MYFKNFRYFLFIFFVSVIAILPISCGKENPVNELIPHVNVNLLINPASPQYTAGPNGNGDLSFDGNWAYVSGGYRGIIIYNAGFDEYKAYERTAPYNYPNGTECRVTVDETAFFAIDPCSTSKYNLLDGSPYEGPATLSLKQYQTQFDGVYLHVFN
jgi:hypothetical protein